MLAMPDCSFLDFLECGEPRGRRSCNDHATIMERSWNDHGTIMEQGSTTVLTFVFCPTASRLRWTIDEMLNMAGA
jgi:hypothetical protein